MKTLLRLQQIRLSRHKQIQRIRQTFPSAKAKNESDVGEGCLYRKDLRGEKIRLSRHIPKGLPSSASQIPDR